MSKCKKEVNEGGNQLPVIKQKRILILVIVIFVTFFLPCMANAEGNITMSISNENPKVNELLQSVEYLIIKI